jgi:cytoskeletal protein CcmA (bactofilin family)
MTHINPPIQGALRRALMALLLSTVLASGASAVYAQDLSEAPAAPAAPSGAQAAAPPEAPEPPEAPTVSGDWNDTNTYRWSRPAVRVGQSYELRAGERVREVVVVFGSATIAGEVDRDVVVVFGSVRLLSTARIHGSLVTTGGGVTIEDGATVGRDFVVTAGGVNAPPAFHPGGDYVIVGLPGMARQSEAIVPFFTRGLLWGRLIVPSLPWLWAVVAVIVLV